MNVSTNQPPVPVAMDVAFRSEVSPAMRSQVEAMFFFNPRQSNWSAQIRQVVEQHGVPEIKEAGGRLTIALRGNAQTQTLFVIKSQSPDLLEGVVIYSRVDYPEILVLHLALADSRPANNAAVPATSGTLDFLRLITAFSKLAKSIAGVHRLRFAYWNLTIPIA
jgi:hypothetical protein